MSPQYVDHSFGIDHQKIINFLLQLNVGDDFLPEMHQTIAMNTVVVLEHGGTQSIEHDVGGVEGGVCFNGVEVFRDFYEGSFLDKHIL